MEQSSIGLEEKLTKADEDVSTLNSRAWIEIVLYDAAEYILNLHKKGGVQDYLQTAQAQNLQELVQKEQREALLEHISEREYESILGLLLENHTQEILRVLGEEKYKKISGVVNANKHERIKALIDERQSERLSFLTKSRVSPELRAVIELEQYRRLKLLFEDIIDFDTLHSPKYEGHDIEFFYSLAKRLGSERFVTSNPWFAHPNQNLRFFRNLVEKLDYQLYELGYRIMTEADKIGLRETPDAATIFLGEDLWKMLPRKNRRYNRYKDIYVLYAEEAGEELSGGVWGILTDSLKKRVNRFIRGVFEFVGTRKYGPAQKADVTIIGEALNQSIRRHLGLSDNQKYALVVRAFKAGKGPGKELYPDIFNDGMYVGAVHIQGFVNPQIKYVTDQDIHEQVTLHIPGKYRYEEYSVVAVVWEDKPLLKRLTEAIRRAKALRVYPEVFEELERERELNRRLSMQLDEEEEATRRLSSNLDTLVNARTQGIRSGLARILPDDAYVDAAIEGRDLAKTYPDCTIMFLDMGGFTEKCKGRDGAEIAELCNDLYIRVHEIATRYGGIKGNRMGDGVFYFFPHSDNHNAISSVRAALEILDAQKRANDSQEDPFFTYDIRIGMHCGSVHGILAGPDGNRDEFVAVSEHVNRTARIQNSTPLGRLYVSPELADRIGDSYKTIPHNIELKTFGTTLLYEVINNNN